MKKARFVSLQTRLNLVFTLLFLVGMIILTVFIRISIDAMAYSSKAETVFTQTRQLYEVKAHLQRFEKSLNDYELTADYEALSEYFGSYARLQQSLAAIAAETESPEEKAGLDRLAQDVAMLRQQFDGVIAAADKGDWEAVAALDSQAYTRVGPIFDQIDDLIQARSDALMEVRGEVATFTTLAWLGIALALPIFLVLTVVVALIISRRIHAPLISMTDEFKHIQEDRFDPSALAPLPERQDEIGYLARQYLQMAVAVENRQADLQQEADEIRAKIR